MVSLLERVRFIGGEGGTPTADETVELPDLAEGFTRDPEPTPAVRKPPRERAVISSATAAKQTRKGGQFVSKDKVVAGLADEINLGIKMLAGLWAITDEHGCPEVLNDASAAIAADTARLLGRSDWLLEHAAQGGLFLDFLKLGATLTPVLKAIWQHHGPGARARALTEQEQEQNYDAVPVNPDRYAPWVPNIATA